MNTITKIAALSVYLTTLAFGNTELTSAQAYVAQRLGVLKVHHHKNDFFVEDDQASHKVQRCFVDKNVRGITKEQLAKFLACGYVSVNKCGEKDYSIKAHPRLVGGGGVGAAVGVWLGWGTVNTASLLTAQGLATVGGIVGGPVGAAIGGTIGTGLHLAFFQPLSIAAGIAGGVALGVATGPV